MNFSGKNFHVRFVDGIKILVETATVNITDNSAVAKSQGIPDGYVDGDVAGDGEIVVDTKNFKLIMAQAKNAGSFQQIPPVDLSFFAGSSDFQQHIEVFGCKLKISALLNIDTKGGSKHTHTIPFNVTSPDFVKIDGIPYINPDESKEVLTYGN